MEQLNRLQREYEETTKNLAFALSIEDFHQLKERRQAILGEAKALVENLNIPRPRWFTPE